MPDRLSRIQNAVQRHRRIVLSRQDPRRQLGNCATPNFSCNFRESEMIWSELDVGLDSSDVWTYPTGLALKLLTL